MVIAVKEGEGLLLKKEEAGIQKFEILGQVVQLGCPLASVSSSLLGGVKLT